jgi:glycosyltransferase involved in cell wall biosynthesis
MKRVLMVSPHFPPDSTAASHRVRVFAAHLREHGWQPTVVSVDPRDYESRLDPELAQLVSPDVEVVRARAIPARMTRRLGFGDLGLRAWPGLFRACSDQLRTGRFSALFITVPPWYGVLLAPALRRFSVPTVVDYIDPWVSEWGRTIGPNGAPDLKSRLSRAIGVALEPRALAAVDAVTAVSTGTYEQIQQRIPMLRQRPCLALPYGFEPSDFAALDGRPLPRLEPEGATHFVYVGTIPPLGYETLRALFAAVALVRRRRPELHSRMHFHFIGSTARTGAGIEPCVLPVARALGVADVVHEIPERVAYLDALAYMQAASVLMLIGSTEPHYTASKIFPVLLARRPVLAIFHAGSSVVEMLGRAARPPCARVVTYDDTRRAEACVDDIAAALEPLSERPLYDPPADLHALAELSGAALTGELAALLDRIAN